MPQARQGIKRAPRFGPAVSGRRVETVPARKGVLRLVYGEPHLLARIDAGAELGAMEVARGNVAVRRNDGTGWESVEVAEGNGGRLRRNRHEKCE